MLDSCSWSADSRFFMVKITHGKMKVDNHFEIYRYNGELMYIENNDRKTVKFDELHYCDWKPLDSSM